MTRCPAAALALLIGVAGCGSDATPPPVAAPRPPVAGGPAPQVILEPDAGFVPVYDLIASAVHTLDMTMYELADPATEAGLAADAARGVRVRVLLDRNREASANSGAFMFLEDHGVGVEWAPAGFEATHEKSILIDGQRLVVMTANLVARDYADTRDILVLDSDAADVGAAGAVLDDDWAGRPDRPPVGDHLVWSPGSEAAVVGLIGSARHGLQVENEEMSDESVIDALIAAAHRGVDVDVTMADSPDWHRVFDRLTAAGVHVATNPVDGPGGRDLYVHAKVVVVDSGTPGAQMFVGSQNFSAASLDRNRELGILVRDSTAVGLVAGVLTSDHDSAIPWPAGT